MNNNLYFSKYNIFNKIADSNEYYLVNLLSGNADILDADKAQDIIDGKYSDIDELTSKGYLINPAEEKKIYTAKYLDFIEQRDSDEVQIFFVPWYACNFDCTYCYQSGYTNEKNVLTKEIIDSFFNYVNSEFKSRKKYLTLFGGEPLLAAPSNRELILYFMERAKENNLDTAIVTNGYHLEDYLSELINFNIREIQVTLDGNSGMHDLRRPLKGGKSTFEKIASGISIALNNYVNINLRMVIDRQNIETLPELANYAIEKGWTKSPYFKTQLGRNYELHYCQNDNEKLLSRIQFYEYIYKLVKQYPHIIEFHKPAFSISKYLFDNGELPLPLFDSCTGCKTEWAFDYTGKIYSCTATVGKEKESLGTYYPEIKLDKAAVEEWEERDVTTIEECKSCNLQLACGSGCASVAFNRTGKLHSPDCRPISELIGMGISLYYNEEN